jgi:septal ring factor EnvC (AmiA/AmiB activator)
MDDEKLERTFEFILNSQAQFYADLQKIQETNRQIQETQKEAEKRVNVLERVCLNLYNTTVEQGKNIAQLTEDIKELRTAQKETGERLNAVIFMAEKFFSNRNGDSEKKQ